MANRSAIEWTESTWNPVTGCTKTSPGCKHCYAERMASRLQAMGQRNYKNGFRLSLHEHALELPLLWKQPQIVFVNSMSDLFHEGVPLSFILRTFDIMHRASWHTFQVLTKRSERLLELDPEIDWPSNVWMGVSVESEDYFHRIEQLNQTGASVKFLSLEPLEAGVPFFFKQWGGVRRKRAGRHLEGRTWDQLPGQGRVKQFDFLAAPT